MTEMEKLIKALEVLEIPHEVTLNYCDYNNPTPQVWYPAQENCIMDAISHKYSYGGEEGLIKIMGLLSDEEARYDDVVGHLTAEDVLERILKHRREQVNKIFEG